jgi:CBS domain-containing protein
MAKMVRDVMQRNPLVIDAHTSIEAAAHLMRASDVDDVLVTEHGKLCGVLTDSEIVVHAIAAGRHPATVLAGDCCDATWPCVAADDLASTAFRLMQEQALARMPVVDDGEIVGVINFRN